MRNLKKILALVLALVMSLSLMATAGAASFPDVDESNPYATAIDVLDQLKVFQGFEDGTFKPTDKLNRAQAAVLVYRIATGDVEGKYVANYTDMAQSQFKDLDGYNWARGYINYCQNAKIVVGTSATTFNPEKEVTGYQLMVMLLRTLGYGKAGEFADPTSWELETAKIAEREGILTNVTSGDFGAAAPRQMVAEILFRGLLKETVQYSALTPGGYTKTGETLGKKNLGLEEIEGVVIANEYADLYDTDTLAAGKTQLRVEDKTYTMDYTTTLEDIGESRLAYLKDGKTVLSIADSGKNAKAESLNEEKNLNRILGEAGVTTNSATERYINFGQGTNWRSDWRIRYEITVNTSVASTHGTFGTQNLPADGNSINTALRTILATAEYDGFILPDDYADYTKVTLNSSNQYCLVYSQPFTIRDPIGPTDQRNIREIFNIADKRTDAGYITGEVYVGTTSMTDVSDDLSLNQFMEKYINETDEAGVSSNERGNWLKVIDNNGDGVADYILKTIYTVAQVTRVKDDVVTLDTKNHTLSIDGAACSSDAVNNLSNQSVVANDDLAAEDVVYYAVIDGKAQAYKADVVTATIDKYVRKAETVTVSDGTEYVVSQVHEHIEDVAYGSDPEDLAGKASYDLFFDKGGYLAAFVKSNKTADYKLITDGWFNEQKTSKEYAVRVYNDETGAQDIVDITANGSLFITPVSARNNGWNCLKFFGMAEEGDGAEYGTVTSTFPQVRAALNGGTWSLRGDEIESYSDRIHTTVAAITEDGTILPVENSSVTGRYEHAMIDLMDDGVAKVPTRAAVNGTIYYTGISSRTDTAYNEVGADDVVVRALNDTVYYVVYPTGSTSVGVVRLEGYSKAPDLTKAPYAGHVEDVYAVGTKHEADNDRGEVEYSADVVVIELDSYTNTQEIVMVIDDVTRRTDVRYRELQVINADGKDEIRVVDYQNNTQGYSDGKVNRKFVEPGLYYMWDTGAEIDGEKIYRMDETRLSAEDIRDAGCFAVGYVKNLWTGSKQYVVTENFISGADNKEGQYDLSETTPMFQVSYDEAATGSVIRNTGYGDADLTTEADYTVALDKQVDDEYYGFRYPDMRDTSEGTGQNIHYYNYNRVLIRYKDNAVVYALSFGNTLDDAEGQWNYAVDVWNSLKPADKKDTRVAITIDLRTNDDEEIDIVGVNADDKIELVQPVAPSTKGSLLVPSGKTSLWIKVSASTGAKLGAILFDSGWKEAISERKTNEDGSVECYIYKLQTSAREVPTGNVIATVNYVVELIKEAKKTIGNGTGDTITVDDAKAVLEELEMYNVPGVIVEENAEEIKDDDGNTTLSEAITTVGDSIDAAETENNEAVNDSLQNLTDALEAWKGVIAGGALSDEYAAKEAIAKEYAEKIKAAADAEKIAELEREALIAMSDEITTTDAELEEELGKIAPLFCSGLTYKIDRGANKIYVTGGTVNPVVDKSTDDVELLEAMMRWYWDASADGDGVFEVVKDGETVTGYKLTFTPAGGEETVVTKTKDEIINAVVKQDTGYAFLTIDCRSIVDMENDQAWLLSRTLTKSEYDTAIAGTGVITCTPRVWQDQDFNVTSVEIDIKDLTWPTAD